MDKKKLIVLTVTNDLSFDQRMQRHCKLLANAGFEVLLVGRERSFSIPLKEEIYRQRRLKCWFNKGKLFYLEYNVRLLFFLLRQPVNIITAIDLDTLLPATLVSMVKKCKLVFDAHEYFTEVPELSSRKVSKLIWQWVADVCIPHANMAYTVGQSLADLFSTQYKIQFETIRNVPPLENLPLPEPGEEKVIFYQGALNEGRGLENLIIGMNGLNAKLKIAGEGDLSTKLRELVQENKLENKVEFLGYVKPVDLPVLTRKAYIGINILEPKGLSYQYSLANKFFDYMHAGIPQVCANFIEYRTINQEFEVALLSSCELEELKENIQKLLDQTELYKRLQQNCLLAARTYNLQVEGIKLLACYQQV